MTPEEKRILAKKKGVGVNTINVWIRTHGEEYAKNKIPASKTSAAKLGKKKSPWRHFKI